MSYVKYISSSLSTNWKLYPLGALVVDNSGMPGNALPVQLPLVQYAIELFHWSRVWGEPFGSNWQENIPGAGSPWSFQEIIRLVLPVLLLRPSLLPGRNVSMKSSKLCHSTWEVLDAFLTMRFPESRSTATVDLAEVLLLILVDHTWDSERFVRRTIFPLSEIVSFDEAGSRSGFSLLATHTEICPGILLYQIPMYHLPSDPSTTSAIRKKRGHTILNADKQE